VAQLSAARDVSKLIIFYIAVQCANRDAALERLSGLKLHVSDSLLNGRSLRAAAQWLNERGVESPLRFWIRNMQLCATLSGRSVSRSVF
jgi:hypothetical protein